MGNNQTGHKSSKDGSGQDIQYNLDHYQYNMSENNPFASGSAKNSNVKNNNSNSNISNKNNQEQSYQTTKIGGEEFLLMPSPPGSNKNSQIKDEGKKSNISNKNEDQGVKYLNTNTLVKNQQQQKQQQQQGEMEDFRSSTLRIVKEVSEEYDQNQQKIKQYQKEQINQCSNNQSLISEKDFPNFIDTQQNNYHLSGQSNQYIYNWGPSNNNNNNINNSNSNNQNVNFLNNSSNNNNLPNFPNFCSNNDDNNNTNNNNNNELVNSGLQFSLGGNSGLQRANSLPNSKENSKISVSRGAFNLVKNSTNNQENSQNNIPGQSSSNVFKNNTHFSLVGSASQISLQKSNLNEEQEQEDEENIINQQSKKRYSDPPSLYGSQIATNINGEKFELQIPDRASSNLFGQNYQNFNNNSNVKQQQQQQQKENSQLKFSAMSIENGVNSIIQTVVNNVRQSNNYDVEYNRSGINFERASQEYLISSAFKQFDSKKNSKISDCNTQKGQKSGESSKVSSGLPNNLQMQNQEFYYTQFQQQQNLQQQQARLSQDSKLGWNQKKEEEQEYQQQDQHFQNIIKNNRDSQISNKFQDFLQTSANQGYQQPPEGAIDVNFLVQSTQNRESQQIQQGVYQPVNFPSYDRLSLESQNQQFMVPNNVNNNNNNLSVNNNNISNRFSNAMSIQSGSKKSSFRSSYANNVGNFQFLMNNNNNINISNVRDSQMDNRQQIKGLNKNNNNSDNALPQINSFQSNKFSSINNNNNLNVFSANSGESIFQSQQSQQNQIFQSGQNQQQQYLTTSKIISSGPQYQLAQNHRQSSGQQQSVMNSGLSSEYRLSNTSQGDRNSSQQGQKGCSCKQSQCLKLYCLCFSNNGTCIPGVCSCQNCKNFEGSQERSLEIQKLQKQNPNAFQSKFEEIDKKKRNAENNRKLHEQVSSNNKTKFQVIDPNEYKKEIQKEIEEEEVKEIASNNNNQFKSEQQQQFQDIKQENNGIKIENGKMVSQQDIISHLQTLKLESEEMSQSQQLMHGSQIFMEAEGENYRNSNNNNNSQQLVKQQDNGNNNVTSGVHKLTSRQIVYKHGCTCKKTNCKKKYCECFNNGVKCSYKCQCIHCHNMEVYVPDEEDIARRKANLQQEEMLALIDKKKKIDLEQKKQQILAKRKQVKLVGAGIDID